MATTSDRKADILAVLDKMRKKEVADKNNYKAIAYAKVIKQLREMPGPVTSLDDLKEVKGIGQSIRKVISELLETGHVEKADAYNTNPHYKIIESLLTIHAIGPAKAKELVETHGITSIEDLAKHPELLNDKQKMGLKYVGEFDLRIPRAEMLKHAATVKNAIAEVDPLYKVEIAGSFRRGEKDSGDIDVLITHPQADAGDGDGNRLKAIVDRFMKEGYLKDIFALGDKKCLAVCRAKHHRHFRRIDLLLTTPSEFPFALLYFTGSGPFNVEMRNHALEMGLSLSEHGFKDAKTGEPIPTSFTTEKEIFDKLGLAYVPPEERKAGAI
jgi:DNA polymerase/3'-5' exonuclease PolX